ncbi:hypothetical protein [Dechloromonas sp. A34]|uniref:hypothetical protein n=1 Tax=Dechloromonas sp. A34 TaxID=447588 RepID=UPI0022495203|nr:hypothetical protein [Dechloromonas sp. A34]
MAEPSAGQRASLTALWLDGGRSLDRLSTALTLLALAAALWSGGNGVAQFILLLGVFLGGLENIYALRVAFDQRIFAAWAGQWPVTESFAPDVALAEFDQALLRMHLRPATALAARSLDERIAGACALLRKQGLCLACQFFVLLTAASLKLIGLFGHGL